MATSSLEEKFRAMQLEIDALDELCCARMKRTVKVESEMRTLAREMEDEIKQTGEANGVGVEQLRKWAVKLGCPDEVTDSKRISQTTETKGPQGGPRLAPAATAEGVASVQ